MACGREQSFLVPFFSELGPLSGDDSLSARSVTVASPTDPGTERLPRERRPSFRRVKPGNKKRHPHFFRRPSFRRVKPGNKIH